MSVYRPFYHPLAVGAAVALWAGLAAAADDPPPSARYEACLALIEKAPKEAFEDAIQWRDEGGGGAAEHCAASALVALGLFEDAAARLESLAQRIKEGPAFKAQILGQAGQAWLLADNAARAEAVATTPATTSSQD